jgi:hypothetical protein
VPSDVGLSMQRLPQNSMVVDDHGPENSSGVSEVPIDAQSCQ